MQQAQNSSDESESTVSQPSDSHSRRRLLLWLGGVLLLGLGGSAGAGWFWLQRQLVPLVTKELSALLNRPVEVGQLTRVSWQGVRFGRSEIPATAVDPDRATVAAVDVSFAPVKLLRHRQLQLNITLVKPDLYVEQDQQKRWLSTQIDSSAEPGAIEIDLQTIRFQDAEIELVARSEAGNLKTPVAATVPSGLTTFTDDARRIEFDVEGRLPEGQFTVDGSMLTATNDISLVLRGKQISATEVGHLIELPLELSAGTIDPNLEIQLSPGEMAVLTGVATLDNVTAKLPNLAQPFANTNGQLRFEGTDIELENVRALFGSVPIVAHGSVKSSEELEIVAQTASVEINQGLEALQLQSPVPLRGEAQATIAVIGTSQRPQVDVNLVTTKPSEIDRVRFRRITADLQLVDTILFVREFQAEPLVGGRLTGTGKTELDSGDYRFEVAAAEIPSRITRAYDVDLALKPGPVSGQAEITGNLNRQQDIQAVGSANFSLEGGRVTASQIEVDAQRWQANLRAADVPLSGLAAVPAEWQQQRLNGVFAVSGAVDSFTPETLVMTGAASINYAGGILMAENLRLADGRWMTQLEAENLQLQELNPQAATPGLLRGTFELAGNVEDLSLGSINGSGTGQAVLAPGIVEAADIQLEDGRFTAVVVPDLALGQLAPQLRGDLAGQLSVAGSLSNFSPTAIQAEGELTFSEGISAVERPLTAAVSWNGQRLNIQQATAAGVEATGYADVGPDFRPGQNALSQVEELFLDIEAQSLRVQLLPIPLPESLAKLDYAGGVNFDGTIAGSPIAPRIEGKLALRNFEVETVSFEPVLTGTVAVAPQTGVNLELAGERDRIDITLAPDYWPQEFVVQSGSATVSGSRQGDWLLAEAQNFPVRPLKDLALALEAPIPKALASREVSGTLFGEFAVDLNTWAFSGREVAIAAPVVGRLTGDSLSGSFTYANEQVALTDILWQDGETHYRLNGRIDQGQEPQLQASVKVEQGQIQEILETLEIFELSDFSRGLQPAVYGDSADLYRQASPPDRALFSVGSPGETINTQLRRLAEIETWLSEARQRREEALLPELRTLEGSFSGSIEVAGSLNELAAEFDLWGQQWRWGPYSANTVIAQGNFQDGILTLVPVRLQTNDSFLSFSGSFGGETQSGQLRLANIPVALVREFVELPSAIGFGGRLNTTVAIAGDRANPQARGELTVENATINQTAIESTAGSFSYNDARLNFFASSVLAEGAEPLTVTGSVPYQLPFAAVEPDNNELDLNINVRDEGLALLDILSRNQVSWVEGAGEVNLEISGSIDPQTNRLTEFRGDGVASVTDATIAAQVVADAPLTEVNGTILFNFDRLEIESLKGKLGGGEVLVTGALPLTRELPQANPLTVTLRDTTLYFKGLYKGDVRGELNITGSALEPDVSGEVELFDGEVLLGETVTTSMGNRNDWATATDFDALRLNLGDNLRLTRQPLLNFLASGSLLLNGTPENPRPEGTIRLRHGQVNLFATQFQLAGGEENTARFSPEQGFDPYLDLRLATSVIETNSQPQRQDPASADVREILPSQIGALQTVRVQAEVEGYASQLTDSIELTSSPPRTETEIVSLLGGGFVNTLGRGDTTLGLANLAGSALFGSVQGAIGEALGLSEFRIFTTPLINDEQRTTALGVAAEASIDITSDLSFSALKILNTEQPAQYGIRYRLNESTVLRGSTDLEDDNRAIVEFEQRF
ncbi:MAG: translocation/assembly module TamB domain-containing protein [Cyanophyceae cyanobacterium]